MHAWDFFELAMEIEYNHVHESTINHNQSQTKALETIPVPSNQVQL